MGSSATNGKMDTPPEENGAAHGQHDAQPAKPVDKQNSVPLEDMEERRKIRRLELMMDMVMSVIGQDSSLTVDEAAQMIADTRNAALAMFPDKELAYNLIYKPRLQRLMRERYRIQ